ncbi:MAG TPA: hypothetical protein ENI94_02475 [Gammaproteobacteria bacterium]|nr:hypothetical protein [Gammaproteobacteria bacterium]
MNTITDYFGDVISSYTREQAIDDGLLVDAGDMAKEAGFKIPVALTQAAWNDCVAWSEADSACQIHQDQSGRLWDVLFMGFMAGRSSPGVSCIQYRIYRVPRDGRSVRARQTALKMVVSPGDAGEPVITIMLPDES